MISNQNSHKKDINTEYQSIPHQKKVNDIKDNGGEFSWSSDSSSNKLLPLNIFQLSFVLIIINIIIQSLSYLLGYFNLMQAIQFMIISILIIIAYIKISHDNKTTYEVNNEGIMVNKRLYLWGNIRQVNVSSDIQGLSLELIPKARLRLMPSIHISNESDMQVILSIISHHVSVSS